MVGKKHHGVNFGKSISLFFVREGSEGREILFHEGCLPDGPFPVLDMASYWDNQFLASLASTLTGIEFDVLKTAEVFTDGNEDQLGRLRGIVVYVNCQQSSLRKPWKWVPILKAQKFLFPENRLRDAIMQILHPGVYFSTNWFNQKKKRAWRSILKSLSSQKDLSYLEIGVYQGQSFIWVLTEFLKGNFKKAVAVDSFLWKSREVLERNIKVSGLEGRVDIISEKSQDALLKLKPESFDLIYIDAAHDALSVAWDSLLSLRLLKPGGFLVFDDYGSTRRRPIDQKPDIAVNFVSTAARGQVELLKIKNNQVFFRKRSKPLNLSNKSFFGDYVYNWSLKELTFNGKMISLHQREKILLESILGSLGFGKQDLDMNSPLWRKENVKKLLRKLQLKKEMFLINLR